MRVVHVQNLRRHDVTEAVSDLDCKLYFVGDPISIAKKFLFINSVNYYTQEELINLDMVGIYAKTPEDAVKVNAHIYKKLAGYPLFNPNSYLQTFQNSYCEITTGNTPSTDQTKEPECKCNLMIGHGPNCPWKAWKDNQ